MHRKLMKFSALSALALTLVAYGCDTVSESALTGPSDKSDVLIVETDGSGYTVAHETDPAVGVVTAVIGQSGGSLRIGSHSLTVPVGAVDKPTTFTMTKLSGDLKVELTATRLLPNDVGSRGFSVPLKLALSYKNATQVPANVAAMKVGWIKADGSIEVQQTQVDSYGKTVVGSLNHFSKYAIIIPD